MFLLDKKTPINQSQIFLKTAIKLFVKGGYGASL